MHPLHKIKKYNLSCLVPFLGLLMMLCFVQCNETEDSWMIATGIHPVQFDNVAPSEKIVFSDSLLLSWKDRSVLANDITYQIIKDKTTQPSSDTFCILKNLTPNSSFLVTIRSERKHNSNIFAEQSISIKAIHDSIVPFFPTTSQVIYVNPFFSWQLEHIFFSHRAFHYELYIDSSASFSYPQIFSTTHDTLTVRGIAIQKDQQYFWKVAIVYDNYPEKFFSKTMTFIGANEPPSVPQPISPANNATGVASPTTFTWHPSTDPENDPITYTLEVKDPAQKIIFSQNNITDTFLQASLSLASETNYTWRVIAKDRTGASPSISFMFTSLWYPFLNIQKDRFNFISRNNPSQVLQITSNTDWEIQGIGDWIHLSSTSGRGNATIPISVDDQLDFFSRDYAINIYYNNSYSLRKTFTVSQTIDVTPFLDIDKSTIYVSPSGGNDTFNISTNTGWSISSPPSWFTLNTNSGMSNQRVIIQSQPNTASNSSRQATLTITSANASLSKTITIMQESECAKNRRLDSLVLVKFYPSTNGANWKRNTGWLTNMPIHQWYGISMTDDGCRIKNMDLSSSGLSGAIPSEIGNLSQLEYLILDDNQLTGSIPTTIGNLTQLKSLSLATNLLSGKIPSSIGNLSQLYNLNLVYNQLSDSMPSTIGSLSSLQYLYVYENQLTGNIPTTVGNLTQLKALGLSSNQFSGNIPSSIGDLTQLKYLNLYNNQLTGSVPTSICIRKENGQYSSHYSVARNSSLKDCGRLTPCEASRQEDSLVLVTLYQSTNGADWIKNTGWLTNRPLDQWYGITMTGDGCGVVKIALKQNSLSGNIPTDIGNFRQLTSLNLSINQLSGNVPPKIGSLSVLRELHMEGNGLSGEIPSEIGDLSLLQDLVLYSNQLSGDIPPKIGNLSQLQRLWLSGNQLSGKIPPEIGNLSQLQSLILLNNQLSGNVPTSICTRKQNGQYTQYNLLSNPALTDCP